MKPEEKADYFCPKCHRHMSYETTNLNGERVFSCPFEKHTFKESELKSYVKDHDSDNKEEK